MNAPANFSATKLNPSWPLRWEEAKGTESERTVLFSIAQDAMKAGDDDVFAAAYDAAVSKDPDERSSHIEDLEHLFEEADREELQQSAVYRWECRTGREWQGEAA